MPDCDAIIDNRVWVGAYIRPDDVPFLCRLGISTVISMQSDQDLRNLGISVRILQDTLARSGIRLFRIPTVDFDPRALSATIAEAVETLEKALEPDRARVYVHCTAGVNRGPSVVAAYLMKTLRFSALEACAYLKNRRYCDPYLEILKEYEILLGNTV